MQGNWTKMPIETRRPAISLELYKLVRQMLDIVVETKDYGLEGLYRGREEKLWLFDDFGLQMLNTKIMSVLNKHSTV